MKDYQIHKPESGIEVIGFNPNWIDEDFNPRGYRIGFVDGDGNFTSAHWWDYQDTYMTISHSDCDADPRLYSDNIKNNIEPTHWFPIIDPKQLLIDLFKEIEHGDEEHREWLRQKMENFYEPSDQLKINDIRNNGK